MPTFLGGECNHCCCVCTSLCRTLLRRGGAHDVGLVYLIGCIRSCTGLAKLWNNAYEIFMFYGYAKDVMHTGCPLLVLTAWDSGQLSLGCC